MLMKNKSWIVQEFYNEYIETKKDILELKKRLDSDFNINDEAELVQKVKYMKFVLKELQLHGINLEDLIILSLGIDVEEMFGGNL